jgi:hypothetical protein
MKKAMKKESYKSPMAKKKHESNESKRMKMRERMRGGRS